MEKVWKRLSLKWMVLSVLLATIPMILAGLHAIQNHRKDLRKSAIQIEEIISGRAAERIEDFFDKRIGELHSLSKNTKLKSGNTLFLKAHLEVCLCENEGLMELALLDRKGREIAKASKIEEAISLWKDERSKSEMLSTTSKGKSYLGDIDLVKDSIPVTTIAVPMEGGRGESPFILSARIDLRPLEALLRQSQIGEGKARSTYLMSRGSLLIVGQDEGRGLHRRISERSPAVERAIAGGAGLSEFADDRGERYLFAYKPTKFGYSNVVSQIPAKEVYRPLWRTTLAAAGWIVVAIGMAFFFSLFLAKRYLRPILQLSKEMAKVSNGDLEVRPGLAPKNEVGILAESFDRMIAHLKDSQTVLREAEEKYRRIFENSKDMVFITKVNGDFTEINQAGIEMLGYSTKEEVMNIPVKETYLCPENHKDFMEKVAKEGFVKDFEVKLKKKNGNTIDVLITANGRRDGTGKIVSYDGIIKDISDRKKIEEELVRSTGELIALNELGTMVNKTLINLDTFFPIALEKVVKVMGYEMGGIHLANDDEKTLELRYHFRHSALIAEKAKYLKYGEGVSGKAAELCRPVIFSVHDHPSVKLSPCLKEEGVQTIMAFPLLAKGKVMGTISLLSRSRLELSQKEIILLEGVGNQLGIAIENAKLFSDIAKAKSEWETTFDSVTDSISIKDKNYRILRANKAVFNRYGMKPAEIIGKKCYEIFYHREGPCEHCKVTKALTTKRPSYGERKSLLLSNGIFEYVAFPVLDKAGEVIAVVDVSREITNKKRMETEKEVINNINRILASSFDLKQVVKVVHSELRKAVDSDRMTITLLEEGNPEDRFSILGQEDQEDSQAGTVCPKEGTPFEKVIKTGHPLIVPDTMEDLTSSDRELFQGGVRSFLVFPLEYKGKVIGTVNFGSKETNHFSENQFPFIFQIAPGLAISIKNYMLLNQIRESEERYRTVVERGLDGVLLIGEDYRLKYANEMLAKIVGCTRGELVGSDFRNFLDGESRQLVTDNYLRRQRGEEIPLRYEFNIIRKDDQVRNVEISSTVIKDSKGHMNTIAFIKDITEQKKMEDRLLQTEKLRSLGEMANGVAHDFNNALAAILGNAQLMLFTAKDEEQKGMLQTIEKVAKSGAQTVRRLQDFTRKRIQQAYLKMDINATVKEAIEITRPKWKDDAQGRGIDIEVAAKCEEIPSVKGNASELKEVITNMIFNAIEAMPRGGKIELRTFQKKRDICLQISDQGMGMTEEVRKKIFEPFFTTKPFTNTGLGLSMSYGIIKRFGGEIEVESKIGKGSTFTIFLPVDSEGKEEVEPFLPARKSKEAKILVIDDEESVRNVLAQILSQMNHQVTVAENGERGIQLFKEKKFDLVLTDLGMPGLSGWEVCKVIKSISPRFPVGMITGFGGNVDKVKIREAGLDFVISKPFDFNQILNIVAETIEPLKEVSGGGHLN
jgi:PAS domain S-box-containing protein